MSWRIASSSEIRAVRAQFGSFDVLYSALEIFVANSGDLMSSQIKTTKPIYLLCVGESLALIKRRVFAHDLRRHLGIHPRMRSGMGGNSSRVIWQFVGNFLQAALFLDGSKTSSN